MSPIGRVFIVINLVLAGAFVMMAGTFLQRHTDYKLRYDQSVANLSKEKSSFEAQRQELSDKLNTLDRELRAHKSALETAKTENASLGDENKRLQAQLADMGTDLKSLKSSSATMADAVDRATADSKTALETATKATEAREAAYNAKETAENALSDAKSKIAELENKLAESTARVAALDQQTKEQEVLLTYVRTKAPGLLVTAQPDLRGVVEQAQDRLCTVRITDNPGSAPIKPGYTMAIFRGDTYKGEAVITEVDGDNAFCTITKTKTGMTVTPGDAAATNINR